MTGKRFASCIMCFALTAALFSVSRGWASENEMNLTEEMTSAQIEDFPIIYIPDARAPHRMRDHSAYYGGQLLRISGG